MEITVISKKKKSSHKQQGLLGGSPLPCRALSRRGLDPTKASITTYIAEWITD